MAKQTTTRTSTPAALKPRTTRKATAATHATPVQPTQEQIRARAYEVFLRRNGGPGDAHDDWLQAERELFDELNQ